MSEIKHLTFEEVNAHVEQHLSTEHQEMAMVSKAISGDKLCGIYATVRPILVIISEAFFIPAKWKSAVKILIGVLDSLCPQ